MPKPRFSARVIWDGVSQKKYGDCLHRRSRSEEPSHQIHPYQKLLPLRVEKVSCRSQKNQNDRNGASVEYVPKKGSGTCNTQASETCVSVRISKRVLPIPQNSSERKIEKCARYGYLPSRHSTRALVKEWECSFDEGWTSVRTDPNKLITRPPPRYLELLAVAYTSESPDKDLGGLSTVGAKKAGDTANMCTNCEEMYTRRSSSRQDDTPHTCKREQTITIPPYNTSTDTATK